MIKVLMDDLSCVEFNSFEKRGDSYQITKWHWMNVDAVKKINSNVRTYFDIISYY